MIQYAAPLTYLIVVTEYWMPRFREGMTTDK